MYTLIKYSNGVIMEGVVLSMSRARARVVAPGFSDALEVKWSGPDWLTEDGQKVTFEFLLGESNEDEVASLPVPEMAARAAGSYAS